MSLLCSVAKWLIAVDEWKSARRRHRYARRKVAESPPPYRMNVGCGAVRFDGWLNMDVVAGPQVDVLWDVTCGLPVADRSCAYIYNEHFLEHLPLEQGVAFLRNCKRALQPGGVLRIAMPSVAEAVRRYYENTWRENPAIEKYGLTWIQTRAEYINVAFRHWGHQWLYDDEELTRRLREAGFERIEAASWGESRHSPLIGRETRPESRLICEATA